MPLWRAARRESENAGCVLLCRLDILETRITVLEEYQPHVWEFVRGSGNTCSVFLYKQMFSRVSSLLKLLCQMTWKLNLENLWESLRTLAASLLYGWTFSKISSLLESLCQMTWKLTLENLWKNQKMLVVSYFKNRHSQKSARYWNHMPNDYRADFFRISGRVWKR